MKLTVVIATKDGREDFLHRAIQSIEMQSLQGVDITLRVGIDRDGAIPKVFNAAEVYRGNQSQAAALNACCNDLDCDVLAFLEDDDRWHPHRMEYGMLALESCDFVSCTQLEVAGDQIIRINDFATPSGWMMRLNTWRQVGPFDEDYRYHLDNEWLGRLNRLKLRRIHQVENTAPEIGEYAQQVRPWLYQVAQHSKLQRTNLMVPLVKRELHASQNMQNLDARVSTREYNALRNTYGEVPW